MAQHMLADSDRIIFLKIIIILITGFAKIILHFHKELCDFILQFDLI